MRTLDERVAPVTDHGEDWVPKVQVPPTHYKGRYVDWDKWILYYWATRNVLERGLGEVLEVGVGSKVVDFCLRQNDVRVTTLDIDPELEPDMVGSVTAMPFKPDSFDAVVCTEVLEHMPFDQTRKAIQEIHRVTRRYAFVTVPRFVLSFALLIRLPVIHLRELSFRLPWRKPLRPGGEHFWEIGRPGYPVRRLRREFQEAGFHIVSEKRPPTQYSSCFFILEKV